MVKRKTLRPFLWMGFNCLIAKTTSRRQFTKQIRNSRKIIELKGRAAKFHKHSITFWVKAVSQPKNKPKSAAATQSLDVTNLETTSVLLCLNCFYYQANLKLINPFMHNFVKWPNIL